MKCSRLVAVLAITATAVLPASGCVVIAGPESSTNQGQASSEYSANDLMFAQMMIPHHEQAVELSELALEVSTSDAIRDLATRIRDGQAPEVDLMQGWLDSVGVGSMMEAHSMEGHGMSGMVSEEDFDTLRSLESPEFDRLFLELMIAHHEGALDMVEMISESENSEVSALATAIVEVQTSEIEEMKSLMTSLSAP